MNTHIRVRKVITRETWRTCNPVFHWEAWADHNGTRTYGRTNGEAIGKLVLSMTKAGNKITISVTEEATIDNRKGGLRA